MSSDRGWPRTNAEGFDLWSRAMSPNKAEGFEALGLTLVQGHAYFLDPRPDLGVSGRGQRVANRMRFELLPLLRSYVGDRLLGPATGEVAGLADRLETRIEETLV